MTWLTKKTGVEELDKTMEEPGFWDNPEKSTAIVQESKHLKDVIERYEKLCADREDMLMLIEIAEEENDTDMVPEVQESYDDSARNTKPSVLRRFCAENTTRIMPS